MIWMRAEIIIIIVTFTCSILPKKTPEENLVRLLSETIKTTDPHDWRVLEALAERHPYIVALLNDTRDYICTGSIINKQCIVTSGNCITYKPAYVAVSTAVYNKRMKSKSIFEVETTALHADYTFDLKNVDPKRTRMHSNIGIVIVNRPILDIFINEVDLGNYYATELQGKKLDAIGYGDIGSNLVGLQYQSYQQTSCLNPKWYYCICGVEYSLLKTYISEFGVGAPVLLHSKLVGISATPCGVLSMKNLGIKYNVFTVVGPYIPWIDKAAESTFSQSLLSRRMLDNEHHVIENCGNNMQRSIFNMLKYLHTFLFISKIYF